jgi:hypothetical protein
VWESCINASLREDFRDWLYEYVGHGPDFPVRGWDANAAHNQLAVQWFWYDDRLSSIDARKWKKHGFKVLFFDPRKAVLAKLTWGGREVT